MRLVVELKREAMADVVLNQLYRYTPLQTTFRRQRLALDGGRPRLMSLWAELLEAFIRFRAEVMTRARHRVRRARPVLASLVGLAIAVAPNYLHRRKRFFRCRAPDPRGNARERWLLTG